MSAELIQFDGRTVAVIAPEDLEELEKEVERLRKHDAALSELIRYLNRYHHETMEVWERIREKHGMRRQREQR